MTHRVDAAVQGMEPAAADPVVDRPHAQPEPRELVPCDNAVLASGQSRDGAVGATLVHLTTYMEVNCTRVLHRAIFASGA